MGKLRYTPCALVPLLLLWSCATAQSDFLSIDCGSSISYTDTNTNIQWTSDATLVTEGTTRTVDTFPAPLNTLRLFSGNQSKYCYRLSNSAVKPGAFFLVRAWFWLGTSSPSSPKNSDGYFRFKLLIDADEWRDVSYSSSNTDWSFHEGYIRALHNSIHFCLARSSSGGDDPFISALELRPLSSTLSVTQLMAATNLTAINAYHDDSGASKPASGSFTARYPLDPFDRVWQAAPAPSQVFSTEVTIDISNDDDKPPVAVLQTAVQSSTTWTYQNRDVNAKYFCVIYFAEIDGKVNATGQRVFNVMVNGERRLNEEPIDVYKEVGAFASYEIAASNIATDAQGNISFSFSATNTSTYPPMFVATELFTASSQPFSFGSSSADVMAIEDLKTSMNLSGYTGDPCLPIGFGYSWVTCYNGKPTTGGPKIQSISLSNHVTGGKILESINNLTTLDTIFLDGNNLEGSIPDMSALMNLQTLDLSNNKLSGSIPESLATLRNLRILNLANNNLTGEIPLDLLQRQQELTLDFRYFGNSFCDNSSNVACTSPPLSSSSKPKHNSSLIVGVVIAVIFVVMLGVALTCFFIFKKPHFDSSRSTLNISTQNRIPPYLSSHSYPNSGTFKMPIPMLSVQELTYEEVNLVTDNFSTQIGRGGFGPVYKGICKNGESVAVKVSSNSSHQGSKEFLNEVGLLSRIHHKNLVELRGFCKERDLTLVYEFMPKGSLFDCLHGEDAKLSPLSWSIRLNILVDAAQGLDYLHHGCHPRIIHRDIKSSNILLNDKLEAKISDFGISRSSFVSATGAPPTTMMGSIGYLDPEYFANMKLTEKVDIYSFGVLLLEVVCGRRVLCLDASHKDTHIVEWVKPYIDRGAIDVIIDVALEGNYNLSSVWKVLDVALACVQLPGDRRPNMSIVFSDLKEAQHMEFERHQSDMFNSLPINYTFEENDSLILTHVLPR